MICRWFFEFQPWISLLSTLYNFFMQSPPPPLHSDWKKSFPNSDPSPDVQILISISGLNILSLISQWYFRLEKASFELIRTTHHFSSPFIPLLKDQMLFQHLLFHKGKSIHVAAHPEICQSIIFLCAVLISRRSVSSVISSCEIFFIHSLYISFIDIL